MHGFYYRRTCPLAPCITTCHNSVLVASVVYEDFYRGVALDEALHEHLPISGLGAIRDDPTSVPPRCHRACHCQTQCCTSRVVGE